MKLPANGIAFLREYVDNHSLPSRVKAFLLAVCSQDGPRIQKTFDNMGLLDETRAFETLQHTPELEAAVLSFLGGS